MAADFFTRRDFSVRLASIFPVLALAEKAFGSSDNPSPAADGISRTAESIHQEVVFKASRKRLYAALTDAKQFDKVVQLGAAVKSGMVPPGAPPAEISHEAGGAFSLFGGYISGRNIELLPSERIVQAWRTANWKPGVFSIVRFEFAEQGSGTKLVFDHTGFPAGDAEHLAEGWKINYWEPLEKSLA
jgi:activator of HSP90 ATPase